MSRETYQRFEIPLPLGMAALAAAAIFMEHGVAEGMATSRPKSYIDLEPATPIFHLFPDEADCIRISLENFESSNETIMILIPKLVAIIDRAMNEGQIV